MKVGSKDAVMVFDQSLKIFVICGFLLALRPGLVIASHYDEVDAHTLESDFVYSPYVGRAYPDQVLLGDSQFHTNLSFDDGLVDTLLDVDEGFRFARGEKVFSISGQPAQLIDPLDFLVITDHAEFLGLAPMFQTSDPTLLSDSWGKWVREKFNSGSEGRMEEFTNIIEYGTVKVICPFGSDEAAGNIWESFVKKVDQYNCRWRAASRTS